jgi:HEAT repeats
MNTSLTPVSVAAAGAVLIGVLGALPMPSRATSLKGMESTPEQIQPPSPSSAPGNKQNIVGQYVNQCANKPAPADPCDKIKKDAIESFKEDLRTLGSSANRTYFPAILGIFKSSEPELRIAAADAVGMIGPQDQDVDALAPLVNDPVPDVRQAVSQAISHGKGSAISLLAKRAPQLKSGRTPETPADAGKYSFVVAPDSTYLFYDSDPSVGRLSYVTKGDAGAFFKAKAKKGPFKLDEFQDNYRYQLQDEEHALDQAQDAHAKRMESVKPPDPTDTQAFLQYMQNVQSVSMGRNRKMALDSYQPALLGSPTVYVLEERQIGQRSYPTRYVVTYQDLALKRPGYRLNWMTVPDESIKTAQATSLAQEQEDLARQKESEANKKRADELDSLTKKKDATEKKQFKKGQSDLEKELGF